jgi:hypothetical protein
MYNNYLTTIPQYADTLRTLGYQKPQPSNLNFQPRESNNPAQKEYRNNWRDEAIQNVYNRLENNKRKNKQMISEQVFPKRTNTNTSQMPFQTSQNMPSFSKSNMSGGANVTSASRLSDQDYEKFRQILLKNRSSDYDRLAGLPPLSDLLASREAQRITQPAPRKEQVQPEISAIDRSNLDLLLQSVEQKVSKGITDDTTYNDVLKIGQYFAFNIYKYNEPTEIMTIINRLEDLEANVSTDIENKEADRVGAKYAKLIEVTLNNLINYLKINSSYIGRSSTERKVLAKATLEPLNKATKVIPVSAIESAAQLVAEQQQEQGQQEEEGQQEEGQQPEEEGEEGEEEAPELPPYVEPFANRVPLPTDQGFAPSKYGKPTLRNILYQLGVVFYAVDSIDVLKQLIYNFICGYGRVIISLL